jgi:hypothetical protein
MLVLITQILSKPGAPDIAFDTCLCHRDGAEPGSVLGVAKSRKWVPPHIVATQLVRDRRQRKTKSERMAASL